MKRPEAFPRLMRAGADASRFAYGLIPATRAAQARMFTGRTPTAAVTDWFARALEHLLRDPGARAELKALIDSYEPPPRALTELEEDAYGPGGPLSGKPRPPSVTDVIKHVLATGEEYVAPAIEDRD